MVTLATRSDPAPIELSSDALNYANASRSEATWRAYESDLRAYEKWGGTLPATPGQVCAWISDQAREGRTAATIQRRLSSLSMIHRAQGWDNPTRSETVREVHKGIRNTIGVAPPNKKQALTSADLAAYFAGLNGDLRHLRDRVLLTWGLSGAFRRSELVGLEVGDLEEIEEGYRVRIRRSKSDQEGRGTYKAVVYGKNPETDPVRLMRQWLEAAEIESGPIFRPIDKANRVGEGRLSAASVAGVVKRTAQALGKNPDTFAGHSLRRGFITEAARAGASERQIAKQSGHKSMNTLRGYIEESQIADADNAVHRLGL